MKKSVISILALFVLALSFNISAYADSPKYKSTKAYVEVLEKYEVEYTYQTGELNDEIINFTDAGDYRDVIDVDAQFIDTEEEMTLYAFDIIKFSSNSYNDVLKAVNMLNRTKNYACFTNQCISQS